MPVLQYRIQHDLLCRGGADPAKFHSEREARKTAQVVLQGAQDIAGDQYPAADRVDRSGGEGMDAGRLRPIPYPDAHSNPHTAPEETGDIRHACAGWNFQAAIC